MTEYRSASQPSGWEAVVVAETRSKCEAMARRTFGLANAGLTTEDVVQTLQIEVVKACRTWAEGHSDKPPSRFINHALRCAQLKIWRSCKTAQDRVGRLPDYIDDVGEVPQLMVDDNPVEDQNRQVALFKVAKAVEVVVSPKSYAVMKAKAEGHKLVDLAVDMGITAKRIHNDISITRKKAREFLARCGIEKMQDAEMLTPEVLHNVRQRSKKWDRQRVVP